MKIKVFGHRGFSGKYPENTMLAFKKAVTEAKVDGIELDVHLSKDDKLVIIHDEKVDRTTDGTGFVRDFTLAELKRLQAGARFKDMYGKVGIPTLEEYCSFIKDYDVVTNIEIKTNLFWYDDIERKTYDMLAKYGLLDRIIISSFNHSSVILMKEIDKKIPCGLLVEACGLGNVGAYANKLGVEYYHPDISTLTKAEVHDCKDHGVGLNVWTVNDMQTLTDSVDWQVDGIISNYPDVAKAYVAYRGC
jgi:glycerophosphoryl diester phosphodiesterase